MCLVKATLFYYYYSFFFFFLQSQNSMFQRHWTTLSEKWTAHPGDADTPETMTTTSRCFLASTTLWCAFMERSMYRTTFLPSWTLWVLSRIKGFPNTNASSFSPAPDPVNSSNEFHSNYFLQSTPVDVKMNRCFRDSSERVKGEQW